MRRNETDLLVVSVLAILAAAIGVLSSGSSNPLRAALSLPFVLFLPGYALSAALLPDGRSGLAERIAFSIGLSIAIAVLGGLLLNLLPPGLTPVSWSLLLLVVTLTSAGYALWRRERRRIPGPGPLVTQIALPEAVLLGGAALLIGLALGLGAIGVNPVTRNAPGDAPFTQLWAVPIQSGQQAAGATAAGTPAAGTPLVIQVGLHNQEEQRMTYRVTLESGGRVLAEWPQVSLAYGGNWQAQVALPPNLAAQRITANAYRDGDTAPYRTVRLAGQTGGSG